MPAVSQAQNRWAHAVAMGTVPGVPKSVGREFINDTPGLPAQVQDGKAKRQQSLLHHLKRRKHG